MNLRFVIHSSLQFVNLLKLLEHSQLLLGEIVISLVSDLMQTIRKSSKRPFRISLSQPLEIILGLEYCTARQINRDGSLWMVTTQLPLKLITTSLLSSLE